MADANDGGSVAAQEEKTVLNVTNLETLLIAGNCTGRFIGSVEKHFEGNHIVMVKPNGTIIVHAADKGVRPCVYMTGAHGISLERNLVDAEVELFATKDGEELEIAFTSVDSICGIPRAPPIHDIDLAILRCVDEIAGRFGRRSIARILCGSNTARTLTQPMDLLASFARCKGVPQKEILFHLEELIGIGWMREDPLSEFPVLVLTDDGRDILATYPDNPAPQERSDLLSCLRAWRSERAREEDVPPYFVLTDRSLRSLVRTLPLTEPELLLVYGVGENKVARYGEELLAVISAEFDDSAEDDDPAMDGGIVDAEAKVEDQGDDDQGSVQDATAA